MQQEKALQPKDAIDCLDEKQEKLIATESTITGLLEEDEEDSFINDSNIKRKHIYVDKNNLNYMMVTKNLRGELFSILRYENGKWEYGLKGMETIPYNLPNLIKGVAEEKVIFITNGEKDADTLSEFGFCSTTAPFSSKNKWKSKFNGYIKNAKVIVLKDVSIEGKEFAEACKKTISFTSKAVKILSIENLAKVLDLEISERTDITTIRNEVHDDKKLIELLKSVEIEILSKRSS